MQIALFGTSYLDLVFVYALGSFRRKVLSGLEYEEIARSQGELLPTLPFPPCIALSSCCFSAPPLPPHILFHIFYLGIQGISRKFKQIDMGGLVCEIEVIFFS